MGEPNFNGKVLTITEMPIFSGIEGLLTVNGCYVEEHINWHVAISRIREETFDAVILNIIFQYGNAGDICDPAKQIIGEAQRRNVPNIIVATIYPPRELDGFLEGIEIIDLTAVNFAEKIFAVLDRIKASKK